MRYDFKSQTGTNCPDKKEGVMDREIQLLK